mmetsp:Transcript_9325/g.12830  ORF Transcript_9325/g.12830 Transcript_9325/m.12830 type:complete len:99 (-) Transcript_9325:938-1234(-)
MTCGIIDDGKIRQMLRSAINPSRIGHQIMTELATCVVAYIPYSIGSRWDAMLGLCRLGSKLSPPHSTNIQNRTSQRKKNVLAGMTQSMSCLPNIQRKH